MSPNPIMITGILVEINVERTMQFLHEPPLFLNFCNVGNNVIVAFSNNVELKIPASWC